MPKFETIQVGDRLFDCRKQQMGNTTIRKMVCWAVDVKEIYPEKRAALCSWNGNTPRMYYERALKKLRRSPIEGASR